MKSPEAARSIAESLVERGMAAGATAADALYAGNRSSNVEVRLGELESVSRSEGEEIGLRLFSGQRSATVATSDLSEETLGALVERCLAMAREAPEDPYAGLAPEALLERGAPPRIDSFDPREPDPSELRTRALALRRAPSHWQPPAVSRPRTGAAATAARCRSSPATAAACSATMPGTA